MNQIEKIIRDKMEDTDRADRILDAIRKHKGKLLSQPIADKIKADSGESRVWIRRQYGMCMLVFGGYGMDSDPDNGLCLYLAHTEKNVRIDPDDIVTRNTAYYEAAKERNRRRLEALADTDGLRAVQDAVDAHNAALGAYKAATAWGTPLGIDELSFRELLAKL